MGIVTLIVSVYVTRRIDKAQIQRLVDAYEIIQGARNMSRPVVAAVCHGFKNDEIKFLLVRTKGGNRWTFPKGHVEPEPPEPPWAAAKREAAEEAGVSGSIDNEPFAHYPHSKGEHAREVVVAAYLMAVESENKPHEPGRAPEWFTPEQAMRKLAEGRLERYNLEYRRVIREALDVINSKTDR